MALITVGDRGVSDLDLSLPAWGAWVATLVLEGTSVPAVGDSLTIAIADTLELAGAVVRAGATSVDSTHLLLVGGAGGLSKTCTPQSFDNPPARSIVDHILKGTGETLAADADATLLAARPRYWSVLANTVGAELDELIERLGSADTTWRVKPDGKIWIGVDAWPATDQDPVIMQENPEGDSLEVGLDAPLLLPGTTLEGRRIVRVHHRVTGATVRASVFFDR